MTNLIKMEENRNHDRMMTMSTVCVSQSTSWMDCIEDRPHFESFEFILLPFPNPSVSIRKTKHFFMTYLMTYLMTKNSVAENESMKLSDFFESHHFRWSHVTDADDYHQKI